ncbi:hypothetical protein AeRB84_020324 [Aphanomyces euteiches]|nr:hypothetical protein AeRB84_020324 [Aphanomyces euteiches]
MSVWTVLRERSLILHERTPRPRQLVLELAYPCYLARIRLPGVRSRSIIFIICDYLPHPPTSQDVLNEAVADDGSGLKRDVFYNTIGPDYVAKIFTLARKYAPKGVKLFYNDCGCDTPGAKANQCFNLVKGLKDKGLIDGMGFQMHLTQNQNLAGQADLFKRFSDIGVTIHVTEMDVGGNNQQQPTTTSDCVWHGGQELQGEPQVRSLRRVGYLRQGLVACERDSVVVQQQLAKEACVCCVCECDQGSSFVAW